MTSPLSLYATMLRAPEDLTLARYGDGSARRALVERWTGVADAVDERALAGLQGPVLDVGCGPGRHLHALARRGIFGIGVDLSPVAVGLARGGGARAVVGSIFDDFDGLPHAGGFRSALLLDGNIGIGGAPERLLRRVRDLLELGGLLVVELSDPAGASLRTRARLETDSRVSDWFDWAEVSAADIGPLLAGAGLREVERFDAAGRWFVRAVVREPEQA